MPVITVLFHHSLVESLTSIGDSALSHSSFSSPSHKNPTSDPLNAASMQHILTASSPQTYDATVIPTTTTNSNYHIKTNSVIAIKETLSGVIASYLVTLSKSALPQSPSPPPPPPYTAIESLHWDAASSKIPNGVIGAVATLSLFVLVRHYLQKLRSRRQAHLTLPSPSPSNTSSSSAPVSDTCPAACFLTLAPAIISYTKNNFRSGAPSASRHSSSYHYVRSHRQSLSPLTTTNELLRQQYLQEFLAPVSYKPSKVCVPPPPFTLLAVSPSVFTFTPEEHPLSSEATDFIHQPNPDYLSATSDEELQQVLNPQSATPAEPSPGLTDMSSPDSGCQTAASDSGANSGYAHGQIIHGSGRDGQTWSRHTVVYGNGPCPCCIGKGGGTYGPNVPSTEKQD